MNELIVYVKELLKNDFDAYLSVLLEGLPPATFARYDLGAAGAYGVYEMKAKVSYRFTNGKKGARIMFEYALSF